MQPYRAFTLRSNGGVLRVLQTKIEVCAGFDHTALLPGDAHPPMSEFIAIWDTGATSSVITQQVVDSCKLQPTGMIQVHGVHGTDMAETYIVNIGLPNGVRFGMINVTKGKLVGGAHALIGMDIITAGDFSISNVGGKTVMTFRCPSVEERDFVADTATLARKTKLGKMSGGMSGGHKKGGRHKGRR